MTPDINIQMYAVSIDILSYSCFAIGLAPFSTPPTLRDQMATHFYSVGIRSKVSVALGVDLSSVGEAFNSPCGLVNRVEAL